jgi:phosphoenolpyruvate carboxykinase (GTP)
MMMGRKPGNTAESCAIIGITSPKGKRVYVAAFLPKGCGKTALSMIIPTIPGWTVRVLGDDIAWLHVAEDGKLWAINPMKGFYDVASGASERSNRAMFDTISKDTLFSNVALTEEGDIWWEGKTDNPPEKLVDWQGQPWTPQSNTSAASENSRFTVSANTCPLLDPAFENPNGVPISALIFGGKRKSVFPLVVEASSWEQGMFLASCVAKDDSRGELKREPFAAPFLGCDINDYMKSWLNIRALAGYNIPKTFMVNWFREDSNGNVLWPGFRENSRILKWIHRRITDDLHGVIKTPIGLIPDIESLDLRGCDVSTNQVKNCLAFNKQEWKKECESISSFYQSLGPGLPVELKSQLDAVTSELDFY